MTDYGVKRGAYGKPWISTDGGPLDWPDGVKEPLNGALYERPSDIAGMLDTKENLSPYHQCQAVVGVIRERSLAWQFKALCSEYDDPWSGAKDEVKDLLRQARRYGGEDRKSGAGTAFHRYAKLRNQGKEVELPTPQMEPWLDAYDQAMKRFQVLDNERFIVCEELRCAGSFDCLVEDTYTGEIMVADIKSGSSDADFAMKPTIQVAIYAHGDYYDTRTGARTPFDCSLTKGLLIHVPFNSGGEPECNVYPLDLEQGWELAKIATKIPQARKIKCLKRDRLLP